MKIIATIIGSAGVGASLTLADGSWAVLAAVFLTAGWLLLTGLRSGSRL